MRTRFVAMPPKVNCLNIFAWPIYNRIMGRGTPAVEVGLSPGAHRVLPLEGLRGFAASLVFLVHFGALFGKYAQSAAWYIPFGLMASFGHVGVDLFFILSGYLIYGVVMKSSFRILPFITGRVRRLYPAFLTVFALYLALSFVFPSRSRLPGSLTASGTYILSNLLLLPGMLAISPMITVAWSLSYEWFFYLGLPIMVALLNFRGWPSKIRFVFVSLLCAAWMMSASSGKQNLGRFAMFGAGILLWELRKRMPKLRAQGFGGVVATILLAGNMLAIGVYSRNAAPQVVLTRLSGFYVPSLFISGAVFTLYAGFGNGWLSRLFSWSGLRYLGSISYSYYLAHGITLVAIQGILGKLVSPHQFSFAAFLLLFVCCYLATLFTAAILYEYVERRFSLPSAARPGPVLSRAGYWKPVAALSARLKAINCTIESPAVCHPNPRAFRLFSP